MRLDPFSKIKLVKDLAEILLAYKAVFNALLNSFSKVLSYIEIILIIFKISF